jgi:hypothetical protein
LQRISAPAVVKYTFFRITRDFDKIFKRSGQQALPYDTVVIIATQRKSDFSLVNNIGYGIDIICLLL